MKNQGKPLRALLIEDVEDDVLLLLNELKRGGFQPDYKRVDTPEVLVQALYHDWDIVFCDYSMPRMNGRQALKIVRRAKPDVPFIFVSGTIGEDIAVEAMRTGAQDYIMKNNLKRLVPAVMRELEEAKVRTERRIAEKRLLFLANYDSLTQLPNRMLFLERLKYFMNEAKKNRRMLAVLHLNLDRFKTANDSLGFKAGDLLLQEVARRLIRSVSSEDVIARFSADEFAVLLVEPETRANVTTVATKTLREIDKPFDIYGCSIQIHASLGVALYPFDAGTPKDLLRNADIATSRAKALGGKDYCFFKRDMAVQLEEQLAMEQALQQALKKRQFRLHYQPQVELQGNKVNGVEALVRWYRSESKPVPPDKFIPLAEKTGAILPLGEWVLREACFQARQWIVQGLPPIRIAVNVSARQFLQDNLSELVKQVLEEAGLDSRWLEIEITESSIMKDTKKALSTLIKLQDQGISVALDDFGTGYSSMSYLKHFKVNTLKVDRTFITDIPVDKDDTAITSAIIAMAKKLNIKVVAEGVETVDQYKFLQDEGCDFVQGYYLCKPMTTEQIVPVLQKQVIELA